MCNGKNRVAFEKAKADSLRTHVLRCHGSVEEEFTLSKQTIGKGSFGEVYVGIRRRNYGRRAVKSISHSGGAHKRSLGGEMHEVKVMELVDHPNVVRLIMTFEDKRHIHMVMELCNGGTLAGHLQKVHHFEIPDAKSILQQVFRSAAYLHSLNICHRDMKLDNFLVSRPGPLPRNTLKAADFGLSVICPSGCTLTEKVGTIMYMSPEMAKGRYDITCDIWSCGLIAFALISGKLPFFGKNEEELLFKIKRGNYMFDGPHWDTPDNIKDIVRNCLRFEGELRSTPQDVLAAMRPNDSVPHLVAAALESGHKAGEIRVATMLASGIESLASVSSQRRAAMRALAWQLDESDVMDFSNYFTALDTDADGKLSQAELLAASIWSDKFLASTLLKQVCPLDYTDFQVIMQGETLCLRRSVYRQAFLALDRDGDGVITSSDLDGVPGTLGKEVEPRNYEHFVNEVLTLHL